MYPLWLGDRSTLCTLGGCGLSRNLHIFNLLLELCDDKFQFFNGIFLWFVKAFQPLHPIKADLLDKVDAVQGNIAR